MCNNKKDAIFDILFAIVEVELCVCVCDPIARQRALNGEYCHHVLAIIQGISMVRCTFIQDMLDQKEASALDW